MLTKKNIKARSTCKVRFHLTCEEACNADTVYLAGSFNDWDERSHPMKKSKTGAFSLELELPQGERVLFRYLLDNGTWINDSTADGYEFSEFAGTDNSVVQL